MIQLELTAAELSVLVDILDCSLSDLRNEIIETDRRSYKEMLKERRQALANLKEKILQAQSAVPAE